MEFSLKCLFFFALAGYDNKNLQSAQISKGRSGNQKQDFLLGLNKVLSNINLFLEYIQQGLVYKTKQAALLGSDRSPEFKLP